MHYLKLHRNIIFAVSLLVISGCAGLTALFPRPDAGPYPIGEYNADIREQIIVAVSKAPFSLSILENDGGSLVTSSKEYKRREEGFLWWKKTYGERTHFNINIRPSQRTNDFIMVIFARSEERPNENYPWKHVSSENDRSRAGALLNHILIKLRVNNEG